MEDDLKKLKMEDDLKNKWKTTSKINGRRPQKNGRLPPKKKGRRPKKKMEYNLKHN